MAQLLQVQFDNVIQCHMAANPEIKPVNLGSESTLTLGCCCRHVSGPEVLFQDLRRDEIRG